MLKSYLKEIFKTAQRGDATEQSYYSVLKGLLNEYSKSINKKNIEVTILPKKTEAGNPDFRIWDGKQHIVGYIEAKDLTFGDLDQIENSEQLKRYRNTFPNLILTNFFEFRLYRNGILKDKIFICEPFAKHKLNTIPVLKNEPDFIKLLEEFFIFSLPKVYDAKTLAIELAKRTRFLKDEVVTQELKEDETQGKGFISGFYEAFRKYLINNLSKEDFVDLYSQTITYGLFAARTRSENGFNRKLAYDSIPHTIGILRDVFKFVSLGELPKQMEWIIDDISEVLAVTDVRNILHQYFHEGKGKDPIVHFYETFLAEYDPKKRKVRGVYYTPEAVVSYIVRSLNNVLKEQFGQKEGFAGESITVLDPAAGTLTFLTEATKLALEEFISKYGEGGKENFIKEHILKKNFYAFEWMMAPYAVGHLKMSFLLEELGYKLQEDDRFNLYLTNTLEMEELAQTELPGMVSLSEESHKAGKVKKEIPILVILGNPPYYGKSTNLSEKKVDIEKGAKYISRYLIQKDNGWYKLVPQSKKAKKKIKIKQKTWIGELIDYYKIINGEKLKERTSKWLQDDYVKFIRFAQWKIDQAGQGVLGFITNHSYLDNPTFRGMRQSLMNSFNEIYILDLHGSTQRKEKSPDGSKDENVFDQIKQGVAISIFIKKENQKKKCKVYHSEIWGSRKKKYEWLLKNEAKLTKWEQLSPKSDTYLFIPRDDRLSESYEKNPRITQVFPLNGVGLTTARDNFVIDTDKNTLLDRIRLFKNSKYSDDELHSFFQIKRKKGWSIRKAWDMLQSVTDADLNKFIIPVLYRPFDVQWIFYHDSLVWRTAKKVMLHMTQENVALITARSNKSSEMDHFFCSDTVMETKCGESTTQSCLFPLYLHPAIRRKDLFSNKNKQANISPDILTAISMYYKDNAVPERIFYYIYAIFYSNDYRNRYASLLRTDFPRVPFTKDCELFCKMGSSGNRLVNLHLLKSQELDPPIVKFQGKGDQKVKKVRYEAERVYINNDQYFEGINKEVWDYQIGGYQICDKWLKGRKEKKDDEERSLSLDDIKQYCKIVTSIQRTIEIQKEIDEIYPEIEKETITF